MVLSGHNSYRGGTQIRDGAVSVSVSADTHLGDVAGDLDFGGGTLRVMGTDHKKTARAVTLNAKGGVIDIADDQHTFILDGEITGKRDLIKQGASTLELTANNAYGNTYVAAGAVIGNSTAFSGDIANAGMVVFDQARIGRYAGDIYGVKDTAGHMVKRGEGELTLDGESVLGWRIAQDRLVVDGACFSGHADLGDDTALTFDQARAATYVGELSGAGNVQVTGAELLLMGDSSDFIGTMTVFKSGLIVGSGGKGALGGTIKVLEGGSLGDTGP